MPYAFNTAFSISAEPSIQATFRYQRHNLESKLDSQMPISHVWNKELSYALENLHVASYCRPNLSFDLYR